MIRRSRSARRWWRGPAAEVRRCYPGAMLPLLLLLACTDPNDSKDHVPPDDTGGGGDDTSGGGDDTGGGGDDTGGEAPEDTDPAFDDRGCHDDGEGRGLPEEVALGDGMYRVVRIPGLFEALYAVVFYPADDAVAYDDGAPVVVVVPPGLDVDPSLEDTPRPYIDPAYGVVEIQPIYPGWIVAGASTGGEVDDGGLWTASTVSEVIRFASGQLSLDGGLTISNIAERPVCNGRVGLLGVGTGGFVAMAGVAPDARTADHLAGIALFEAPSVPQIIAGDMGTVAMDPDPEVDGDGDGLAWDDGRNLDFVSGSCTVAQCTIDYDTIAWDGDASLAELYPDDFAEAGDGVLYLDRSGSGALEWGSAGTDADGDGVVGSDEDFVLLPHLGSDGVVTYSPDATLNMQDVVDTWPDEVASLGESESFWSTRTLMGEGAVVASSFDTTLPVVVGFTAADRYVALPERPQIVAAHDLFGEAGFPTRYNLRTEALDCLTTAEERGDWTGGPRRDASLEEGELQPYAIPESVADPEALVALAAVWDGLGAFDRCRE